MYTRRYWKEKLFIVSYHIHDYQCLYLNISYDIPYDISRDTSCGIAYDISHDIKLT